MVTETSTLSRNVRSARKSFLPPLLPLPPCRSRGRGGESVFAPPPPGRQLCPSKRQVPAAELHHPLLMLLLLLPPLFLPLLLLLQCELVSSMPSSPASTGTRPKKKTTPTHQPRNRSRVGLRIRGKTCEIRLKKATEASSVQTSPFCEAARRRAGRDSTSGSEFHFTRNQQEILPRAIRHCRASRSATKSKIHSRRKCVRFGKGSID